MEPVTQADLARVMDVSEMTVSRITRALSRSSLPLSDKDAVKALAVKKLARFGFTLSVGMELLGEFETELDYLFNDSDNRFWIVFVEREDKSFRVPAISIRYLESLLEAVGMALVIPVHIVIADARGQLALLKASKQRAAE